MHKISSTPRGQIYVVSTPIGNLGDITLRAIETLKSVDLIAAEDTRHSQHLLQHYGIQKPLTSLHSYNEESKSSALMDEVAMGKSIALISDAGTPLISDPGFPLIRLARQKGVIVTPIPGCCALIAALSASGIPCQSFFFAGFLSHKSAARYAQLKNYADLGHTVVFYESPHRLGACIRDIASVYGEDYGLVLAKELSKTHERFVNGTAAEILDWLAEDSYHNKGEFVIILPALPAVERDSNETLRLLELLLEELPLKRAVKLAVAISGQAKNYLYQKALEINEKQQKD